MQTVILSAGKGTRLAPLSNGVPKPMLPVGSKPLVAHVADAAVSAGATELVFVVGYEGDAVRRHFGDEYHGVPIKYVLQREQAGTAHAVMTAREVLDGQFAVLNGDNYYEDEDVKALFDDGPAVGAFRVADPGNYGVLTADGGVMQSIIEKPDEPPSNLANAGAYVFPERALDWLDVPASERGEQEITDVLMRVAREFPVKVTEFGKWLDVGRAWELLAANERELSKLERDVQGEVSERAELVGNVVVEQGAVVRSGVVIEGPALIRSGARVGPNAYIRGATLVCQGAKVGHSVEIKNSVLMDGATVGHLSYVGDSILGRDVNFGAGTTVANLRHDDQPVKLTVKGERLSTGRRKFGTVVGHGTKTGVNTSIYPGVTFACNALTIPGEQVTRDR